MDMHYVTLRQQLDELGYRDNFSQDCLPLVEKLTADLFQTTKSLQHYMSLSKETVKERDNLKTLVDPYIYDNSKLVKENNQLHYELSTLKEDIESASKKSEAKIKKLRNEISMLEFDNRNLKIRCKDNELKNLRADTFSSRSKNVAGPTRPCCSHISKTVSKNTEEACRCNRSECCVCIQLQSQLENISKECTEWKENNEKLIDEIDSLKTQIENRDKDNSRLRKLLEGGRPVSALQNDYVNKDYNKKLLHLNNEIRDYESHIGNLNSQLKESLDKQHEAMSRAIHLADKNKVLEKELRSIDQLALKIESDFNSNLKDKCQLVFSLQNQLDTNQREVRRLQNEVSKSNENASCLRAECESLKTENYALKLSASSNAELKDTLIKENKLLIEANKRWESARENGNRATFDTHKGINHTTANSCCCDSESSSRKRVIKLLEEERQIYIKQIEEIKQELSNVNKFNPSGNNLCSACNERRYPDDHFTRRRNNGNEEYMSELRNKICELEQRIQSLKKQNEVLIENNHSLKICLEQSKLSQSSRRPSLETENYLQLTINKLERDLKRAHSDIQHIEEERNSLRSKLRTLQANHGLEDENASIESRRYNIAKNQYKQEIDILNDKIKGLESELLHVKSLNNQLKALQQENDKNISSAQAKSYEFQREIQQLKDQMKCLDKIKLDLEHECLVLKSDKMSLRDNLSKIDQERDKLIIDIDDKTERIASLEHDLRSKVTNIEMLDNKLREFNKKMELTNSSNATLEHRYRDSQTRNEALSIELDSLAKQRDSALIENKRLQSDLAVVASDLRTVNKEYDLSRKEVEQMKNQLQHYVDEVRRIEEILSRKEVERTEMLDHFASLSHEATVLESNNHSLENESASKSAQLHATMERVAALEEKLESRESLLNMHEEKVSKLIYNISRLESELLQQQELTKMAEKNLEFARDTCATLEKQKKSILIGVGEIEAENKKLEYHLKVIREEKNTLELVQNKDRSAVESLETLLNNSRREVVDLKLQLQEAIEETKMLKGKLEQLQDRLRRVEGESLSSRQRSEEAAKNLQELQWQINDERFQRVRMSESMSRHHTSTL